LRDVQAHTSTTNHRGETLSFGRDVDGRTTSRTVYTASGAMAQASYSQFDSRGRVAATTDTRGNSHSYQYAADGRPAARINPLGHNFGVQFDVLDRPLLLTQPNTTAMVNAGGPARVASSHAYDPIFATHQSTTDTVGVPTGYATDALNRHVAEAGNDAGPRAVARNAAGDVISSTDARGVTLNITRDSLGRVTSISTTTGPPLTYSYVPGRKDSLLAGMTDRSGSTSWGYDAQGRLLSKSQNVAGVVRTLNITRDTIGRVSGMTYPSGMRVDVAYSGDVVSSLSVNGATLLYNISYRPFSQTAQSWTWGNGVAHSRTFDADGRVTSVSLGSVQRSYGYDAAGPL
jgi:YD repeat-containing protein